MIDIWWIFFAEPKQVVLVSQRLWDSRNRQRADLQTSTSGPHVFWKTNWYPILAAVHPWKVGAGEISWLLRIWEYIHMVFAATFTLNVFWWFSVFSNKTVCSRANLFGFAEPPGSRSSSSRRNNGSRRSCCRSSFHRRLPFMVCGTSELIYLCDWLETFVD